MAVSPKREISRAATGKDKHQAVHAAEVGVEVTKLVAVPCRLEEKSLAAILKKLVQLFLVSVQVAVLYFHRNVPWIDAVGMLYLYLERMDIVVYQASADDKILEHAAIWVRP